MGDDYKVKLSDIVGGFVMDNLCNADYAAGLESKGSFRKRRVTKAERREAFDKMRACVIIDEI